MKKLTIILVGVLYLLAKGVFFGDNLGILHNCYTLHTTGESAPTDATINQRVMVFHHAIGESDSQRLHVRLVGLNRDISQKGILPLPGTSDALLTGYAYHEFYDWDLYFENLYLYYGINDYCFTNFKVFLATRSRMDLFRGLSTTRARNKCSNRFWPR